MLECSHGAFKNQKSLPEARGNRGLTDYQPSCWRVVSFHWEVVFSMQLRGLLIALVLCYVCLCCYLGVSSFGGYALNINGEDWGYKLGAPPLPSKADAVLCICGFKLSP